MRKIIIEQWQKRLCKKSDREEADDIVSKPFPDYFLRGFNMKDCFTAEQNVAVGAFQFGDYTQFRNDDYHEASINWEDSKEALALLLEQKKEGSEEPMFKYGYARLPLNLVRMVLKSFIEKDYLGFERKPLENNAYHGNILMSSKIKKQEKTMIQNNLAAIANNDAYPMNL